MSGTQAITDALKKLLRSRGITYAAAADALGLSEASVKRLFAEQSFTLKRMETLAHLAGAELTDLVRMSDDEHERIEALSLEVERTLVEDPPLLLCAICVINRYRFQDILDLYAIDEHELQRKFAALDRLQLIELLPDNRYRMRLSRGFAWRPGGPIESFFVTRVFQGFFDKALIRDSNNFRFAWGTLTPESARRFVERMRLLYDEFNSAADRDARLPIAQRNGSVMMMAFRTDWEPEEFAERRHAKTQTKRQDLTTGHHNK